MRIDKSLKDKTDKPQAVTIGNFDGLHAGHRRIIEFLKEKGRGLGLDTTVLSFNPHPAFVLRPNPERFKLLSTPEEKAGLLEGSGVTNYAEYPFTPELAGMDPETFVRCILAGKLNTRLIAVGEGFRFAVRSSGTVDTLRRLSGTYGFQVYAVSLEMGGTEKISSSAIKEMVAAKDFPSVKHCLARDYSVSGVLEGGNDSVFIRPPAFKLLPPDGCYEVTAEVCGQPVISTTARVTEGKIVPGAGVFLKDCTGQFAVIRFIKAI